MDILKTFLVILTILLPVLLFGQQYQITRSVIGAGGGIPSDSTVQLFGTLGQPLTGESISQTHNIKAGFWSQAIDFVTSVEKQVESVVPTEFKLEQNYPNPFNPTTTIQFAVPKQTLVTIKIYDLLGRLVTTLVDDEFAPGVYKVNFRAEGLPSGVYFYRLRAEGFVETRKLTLLR